jgi:hypothetical protein
LQEQEQEQEKFGTKAISTKPYISQREMGWLRQIKRKKHILSLQWDAQKHAYTSYNGTSKFNSKSNLNMTQSWL